MVFLWYSPRIGWSPKVFDLNKSSMPSEGPLVCVHILDHTTLVGLRGPLFCFVHTPGDSRVFVGDENFFVTNHGIFSWFFHGDIGPDIFWENHILQWGYNYGEFSPINYDITPNTMMTHLHLSLELLPQVVSGNQALCHWKWRWEW